MSEGRDKSRVPSTYTGHREPNHTHTHTHRVTSHTVVRTHSLTHSLTHSPFPLLECFGICYVVPWTNLQTALIIATHKCRAVTTQLQRIHSPLRAVTHPSYSLTADLNSPHTSIYSLTTLIAESRCRTECTSRIAPSVLGSTTQTLPFEQPVSTALTHPFTQSLSQSVCQSLTESDVL